MKKGIDYSDPKIRKEILVRQRRNLWTPEQIESLAKHFHLKPGIKLLDAGCGYGYVMQTFGPYCMPGSTLVGLDIEKFLLKTARQLTKKEIPGSSLYFCNSNIYKIPFSQNTFDIAIAHVIFCHLSEPEKALDELIRVTKKGGCIAIFDNASEGGPGGSWDNVSKSTIKQKLFNYEIFLRTQNGRKKRGEGDYSVGCYISSWMEKRGLKNIDARVNERVIWIAPPYRSPAQKTCLQNMKEGFADWSPKSKAYKDNLKEEIKTLRAGGADANMIRRYIRSGKKAYEKSRKALANGTLAFASVPSFWCVWGFKS